ncbi:mannose-1-phosphate guanylyltransferase [Micavibrio aeruginosavorus]|uniref:Nucleotidyl transferase family protein n=1 Tax=Micavibrio aeruginosavorus (strain ARL-13) TaxID=856793 RepID=G2KLK0_MICAA|nr:mannose-1-phosphate guanylyltransferase [Micavibrio aeruginosavorus]AEP08830.1 nucleotidyl transferase family protein [Micavibrio aeruginosavorus ARL-13]
MLHNIIPVILCGGVGRRLWPLSTPRRPKPFLRDMSGQSLLQQTMDRARGMKPPVIVCNKIHADLVRRDIGTTSSALLLEPCGRNTAPAMVAAAHYIQREFGSDAVMLIMPSDHFMADPAAVGRAALTLWPYLDHDIVGVFGVRPTRAETGYGYIQVDVGAHARPGSHAVRSFVEKPDRELAQTYLDQGCWWWNSGLFLARAKTLLDHAQTHASAAYVATGRAVENGVWDQQALHLSSDFADAPAVSFDKAVMERIGGVRVAALETVWSDLGTWSALAKNMCANLFSTG